MGITHTRGGDLPLGQRVRTDTQTANYTVTALESGTHFNNRGASALVVFTLPALAAGLYYLFTNSVLAQDLRVSTPNAGEMVAFNDIAANEIAYNTANERAGGGFYAVSDGTDWIVMQLINTLQSATLAT